MDSIPYTSPAFLTTLLLGGVVMALVSGFMTYQQAKGPDEQPIKPKGVIRDVLLGSIFTAMAWHVAPDTMTSVTSSVSSTFASAAESATTQTSGLSLSGGGGGPDIDLQTGPALF